MDGKVVGHIFGTMAKPPRREADVEIEIVDVPEIYLSSDSTQHYNMESCKDPESVWSEVSRFIKALEKKRKLVEDTEAACMGITQEQSKAKLSSFLDHLHFYLACEPEDGFCLPVTGDYVLSYEGSVLSVAGQALAKSLVSGCAVMLLSYEMFSSTAKLLASIWTEVGLPAGRFHVTTNIPQTAESLSKIFVGGQPVEGPHDKTLKPYCLNGHFVPMLVLDGADIESVVSVVLDKAHILRHVEPWALSAVIIEESQLMKFTSLLFERLNDASNPRKKPSAEVQQRQVDHIRKYHLENTTAEIHHLDQYRYIVFSCQPSRTNRLWHHDLNGSPLYILPVRSAAEAVAKANHYSSRYAAAVYTEDGSLSQWVAEKLQASTVWINTIGQLHPAAPLPFQVVNTDNVHRYVLDYLPFFGGDPFSLSTSQFSQEVVDKVKAAVAAQPAWESLGGLGRTKIFFKLLSSIEERFPSFAKSLREIHTLLKRTSLAVNSSYTNQESDYAISTHLKPHGVIGIYLGNYFGTRKENTEVDEECKVFDCSGGKVAIEIIQGAIAYGNTCVVIIGDDTSSDCLDLLYGPNSCLPKGVVNIIKSRARSYFSSLVQHMEVKALWHTGMVTSLKQSLVEHFEAIYSRHLFLGIGQYLAQIPENRRFSTKHFERHAATKKHIWRKIQSN